MAACTEPERVARAMAITEQLPQLRGAVPLPLAEVQTLIVELLAQRALQLGFEQALLESPAYQRYAASRGGSAR